MGMTMAEKILARASGRRLVHPGEIVTAKVDRTRLSDHRVPEYYRALRTLGIDRVWDPERVVVLIEHNAPASSQDHAGADRAVHRAAPVQEAKGGQTGAKGRRLWNDLTIRG